MLPKYNWFSQPKIISKIIFLSYTMSLIHYATIYDVQKSTLK